MKSVVNALNNCILLEEDSIKQGAERASLIWANDVVFDPRVNLKCQQNLCTHYGKNFMCPPYTPDSAAFMKSVEKFRLALLLQVEKPLDQDLSIQAMEDSFKDVSLKLLEILISLEKDAFKLGFSFSMALGSGHCKLCTKCPAGDKGGTCIKPAKARPSMEALGIDVIRTCHMAGFPADFSKELVRATGLLYLT